MAGASTPVAAGRLRCLLGDWTLAAGKIAGGIGLGALALVLVLFGLAVRRWTGKDVEDY